MENDGGTSVRRSRRETIVSTMKRSARLWGFLGFALLVLFLARRALLPFIFGALLAYILAPIVRRISVSSSGERRMPRGAAIVICYIVILAATAAFWAFVIPRLSVDASRLADELPTLYEKADKEWAPELANWIDNQLPQPEELKPKVTERPDIPYGASGLIKPMDDGTYAIVLEPQGLKVSPSRDGGFVITPKTTEETPYTTEDKIRASFKQVLEYFRTEIGSVFAIGKKIITSLLGGFFSFFVTLMIAAFLMIDLEKIHKFVRSLFPAMHRDDYDVIVKGIDEGLSGVIRGQVMICLVNGVLTYVGLLIFSVKYSLILAVVATLLSLIPIFGTLLSTVPIVIAALVSGDSGLEVTKAIAIVVWIGAIHFVEANLLNPKIIGTSAKIHPVLVIFALIVGEKTWGLTGALLAVPTWSIIQVIFLYIKDKSWKQSAGPESEEDNG